LDGSQVWGIHLRERAARLLTQIRREQVKRFGAFAACVVRARVQRVAEVRENDFGKIRVKASKLIELALKALLPLGPGGAAHRGENWLRSNRQGRFRRPREPINDDGDDCDIERNPNDRMFEGQPK